MALADYNGMRRLLLWLERAAQKGLRMIQYPIVLLLLTIAVWGVCKLTAYLVSLVVSPSEIVLTPFDTGSEAQKTAGQTILSAKLHEMQAFGSATPTGYGFLNVPLLEATPRQAEQRPNALSVLDKIELKIKDVNVSTLLKTFDEAFAPVRYELHGNVTDLPAMCVVSCRLVRRGDVVKSWEASERATAADTEAIKAARFDNLLDKVLFQMVFDFAEEPRFREWNTLVSGGHRFNNWQSLRGYTRGLRALRSYQENLRHEDLDDAIKFFDELALAAPDEPYGIYFLAQARSENREEDEAISEFEQLQRLLERLPQRDPWMVQMLHEAKFTEAAARLKLYKQKEGDRALASLSDLVQTLEQEMADSSTGREEALARTQRDAAAAAAAQARASAAQAQQNLAGNADPNTRPALEQTAKEAQASANQANTSLQMAETALQEAHRKSTKANSNAVKLLAISHAQLAYTYGTILSFFREAGTLPGDYGQRIDDHLAQAEAAVADLAGQWASTREEADVQFRLQNARGYGQYRRAHFEAADDASYREACRRAIGTLERANSARPNHYEVLQNMGMIYADERFDPDGNFLSEARRLFERTKAFVPRDYYQYEQLALIQWRWAVSDQTLATAKPHLDEGVKEAALALAERPGSTRALHLLALFAQKSWQLNDRPDDASATAVFMAFLDALPAKKHDARFRVEFLAFLAEWRGMREKNPIGLNDLAARVLEFGRGLKSADGQVEFVRFAKAVVERGLGLTQNFAADATLKPIHERAAELQQQADAVLAAPNP